MRVLIIEPCHSGHYYHYVGCLLRRFRANSDKVLVAISREGRQSEEFLAHLAPYSQHVEWIDGLPAAAPWLPVRQRRQHFFALGEIIRAANPDRILIPSGDAYGSVAPWARFTTVYRQLKAVPTEIGIHFGLGSAATRAKAKAADFYKRWSLNAGPWHRIHCVNRLFFEDIARRGGDLAKRVRLLPDPVPANPRKDKVESRRMLGIPTNGRYIGLAASLDPRKAVREFLGAFRQATKSLTDRVLLAGRLAKVHRRAIDSEFQDLIQTERLHLIDRFLTTDEYRTALTALDVVCAPYPNFGHLSATVLHAVAAGRPLLVNNFGWSADTVARFNLGSVCDVLNEPNFAAAISNSLETAASYVESAAVQRLRAFHSEDNFAALWLQDNGAKASNIKCDGSHCVYQWPWVLNG